jgi:hypothetical protein
LIQYLFSAASSRVALLLFQGLRAKIRVDRHPIDIGTDRVPNNLSLQRWSSLASGIRIEFVL